MRRIGRDPPSRAGGTGRGAPLSADSDWLRDLFEPVWPITIRRMFGGAGLYRDGVMFALVSGEDIYLKSDDTTLERFRAAGCRPFVYDKGGREVTMSYWTVPGEALDDGELLKVWAELAYEAALRGKKPRRGQRAEDA